MPATEQLLVRQIQDYPIGLSQDDRDRCFICAIAVVHERLLHKRVSVAKDASPMVIIAAEVQQAPQPESETAVCVPSINKYLLGYVSGVGLIIGGKCFFIHGHGRNLGWRPSEGSEDGDGAGHTADQGLNLVIDSRSRIEVYRPVCKQCQQPTPQGISGKGAKCRQHGAELAPWIKAGK